jgi:DNA polymerase I-like protein with 3'-5' exonuclease and polymerase domains
MIYGILYGQGASGLGTMYGVREDYAKTYINFIFNEYPELRTWRMGLLNAIDERNYLRNPYGRIRWLWNRMFATEAFICLPQGCAADVIYESMIELKQRLPKPARMAMQVHDSILIACPASMRDEVSTLQKEIMTKPREALRGYHIPIKQGAGRSYEEATHEEGLHGDWRRLRRVVR